MLKMDSKGWIDSKKVKKEQIIIGDRPRFLHSEN